MDSPVAVEPVNETISTSSVLINASLKVLPGPRTRLTDPFGSSLLSRISKINRDVKEEYSEGFKTIVFPHASAGIIFLITVERGKFHGVINKATPRGL